MVKDCWLGVLGCSFIYFFFPETTERIHCTSFKPGGDCIYIELEAITVYNA